MTPPEALAHAASLLERFQLAPLSDVAVAELGDALLHLIIGAASEKDRATILHDLFHLLVIEAHHRARRQLHDYAWGAS